MVETDARNFFGESFNQAHRGFIAQKFSLNHYSKFAERLARRYWRTIEIN